MFVAYGINSPSCINYALAFVTTLVPPTSNRNERRKPADKKVEISTSNDPKARFSMRPDGARRKKFSDIHFTQFHYSPNALIHQTHSSTICCSDHRLHNWIVSNDEKKYRRNGCFVEFRQNYRFVVGQLSTTRFH